MTIESWSNFHYYKKGLFKVQLDSHDASTSRFPSNSVNGLLDNYYIRGISTPFFGRLVTLGNEGSQ